MSDIQTVECPHCGKPVPWTEASKCRPFCSDRCRLIDLGDWLAEKHAIPTDDTPLDQDDPES